jgi:hypothetical protein
MDPERLARLKHEASLMRVSMIPESVLTVSQLIGEIILDRDWHRDRVQVTDDDIRRVGLDRHDSRLARWAPAPLFLEVTVASQNDRSIRLADCRPEVINGLAAAVGRSPLDVLDEIAATEVER